MTGGFPSQRASNAENVSIWWRHHGCVWNSLQIWWQAVSLVSSVYNNFGRNPGNVVIVNYSIILCLHIKLKPQRNHMAPEHVITNPLSPQMAKDLASLCAIMGWQKILIFSGDCLSKQGRLLQILCLSNTKNKNKRYKMKNIEKRRSPIHLGNVDITMPSIRQNNDNIRIFGNFIGNWWLGIYMYVSGDETTLLGVVEELSWGIAGLRFELILWSRDKMAAIFSDVFSCMKNFVFWWKFNWSLFQGSKWPKNSTGLDAWCRISDKPSSEPLLNRFTNAYMQH